MITEQAIKEFLEELKDLSLKHGIFIGGCGCCGSPFLYELEPEERGEYEVEINHLHKTPSVDFLKWKRSDK